MKTRKIQLFSTVLMTGAGMALSTSANASVNVLNPSFEDTVYVDQGSGTGTANWVNGSGGTYNPQDGQFTGTTGAPGTIPGTGDGTQVAYMNGSNPMYQNVGTIEATSAYELTVAIGQRLDLNWSNLTVELRADSQAGTVLASDVFDAADAPDGTFSDVSISFGQLKLRRRGRQRSVHHLPLHRRPGALRQRATDRNVRPRALVPRPARLGRARADPPSKILSKARAGEPECVEASAVCSRMCLYSITL